MSTKQKSEIIEKAIPAATIALQQARLKLGRPLNSRESYSVANLVALDYPGVGAKTILRILDLPTAPLPTDTTNRILHEHFDIDALIAMRQEEMTKEVAA